MRTCSIAVLGIALACVACDAAAPDSETPPESEPAFDYEVGGGGDLDGTVVVVSGERVRVGSSADQERRTTRVVGEDGTVHLHWDMSLADDEIIGEMGGHGFGRVEDFETDQDLALWQGVVDSATGEVLAAVSSAAVRELDAATYPAEAFRSLEALSEASHYLEEMASPPDPATDDFGEGGCEDGVCAEEDCAPGDPRCNHLCADDQFQCEDGTCIPYSRECDGTLDCSLGDDEDWCEGLARRSAPEAAPAATVALDDQDAAGSYRHHRCGMKPRGFYLQNYPRGVFLCEHGLQAHNGPRHTMTDPDDDEAQIGVCKSRYAAAVYSGGGRKLARDTDWRGYANAVAHITSTKVPCVRMKFWATYRAARWKRQCSYPCSL